MTFNKKHLIFGGILILSLAVVSFAFAQTKVNKDFNYTNTNYIYNLQGLSIGTSTTNNNSITFSDGTIFNQNNAAAAWTTDATGIHYNSGNVGIGVTDPNSKLDVNGAIYGTIYYDKDNTSYYINPSGGTSALFSGNVGIGTTNPNAGLHIQNNDLMIANDSSTGGSGIARLNFSEGADGSAGTSMYIGYNGDGFSGDSNKLFVARNSDGAEHLTVQLGGNVGIGDSSPSDKLEVAGNVRANTYYDRNNTSYYLNPSGTSNMSTVNATGGNVFDNEYHNGGTTITVDGNADTYYPVEFKNDGVNQTFVKTIQIYRNYSETAPDTWNTSSHKGALVFKSTLNFGSWGGSSYDFRVDDFREKYSRILYDAKITNSKMSFVVWLRGGTAKYHISGNWGAVGSPNIYYSQTTLSNGNTTVSPKTGTPTLTYIDSRNFFRNGALYSNGNSSFDGTLNLNSNKIINLATPTANSDAANKSYVDSSISGGTTSNAESCNADGTCEINAVDANSTGAHVFGSGDNTITLDPGGSSLLDISTPNGAYDGILLDMDDDQGSNNFYALNVRLSDTPQGHTDNTYTKFLVNAQGNLLLNRGTTLDTGYWLDVNGNVRFSGDGSNTTLTINNAPDTSGSNAAISANGMMLGDNELDGSGQLHLNNNVSGDIHMKSNVNMNSNNIANGGNIYGNVFYDENNTSYYVNPASGGTAGKFAGTVELNGSKPFGGDNTTPNSTSNSLWSIGSGSETLQLFRQDSGTAGTYCGSADYHDCYIYMMSDSTGGYEGAAGILYGRVDGNNSFDVIMEISQGGYLDMRGSNITNGNNIYGSVFYDEDNTSYYANPSSSSRLNQGHLNHLGVGTGANTTYRIYATGDSYGIRAHGSTMGGRFEDSNSSARAYAGYGSYDILANGTGRIDATSQMRSPIYYDRNNTSYYIDPANSGTAIKLNGGDIVGVDKLNANTVDPIYTIGNSKYATYMAGMTGVKEETTGSVNLTKNNQEYTHTIDFQELDKGSDLWIFWQTTDLGKDWKNLSVLLTGDINTGDATYELLPKEDKLVLYGEDKGRVSYRLTAPRFDHDKWGNDYEGDSKGLIVPVIK